MPFAVANKLVLVPTGNLPWIPSTRRVGTWASTGTLREPGKSSGPVHCLRGLLELAIS